MKLSSKFILNESLGSENHRPLYLQLTLDRKTTKRAIGHSCDPKDWNSTKEESRIPAIQQSVLNLKARINDFSYEFQKSPRQINVKQVADLIFGKERSTVTLLGFFADFAQTAFASKQIGRGTLGQYQTCSNALRNFVAVSYGSEDIDIRHVDFKFIEKFNVYLSERNLDLNTVSNKYHKKLKSCFSNAMKHGHIAKNPYDLFPIKFKPTHRDYLTTEELAKLKLVDLKGNSSLEKVRDLFLFSCYTGLRFSDAQALKMNQIIDGETGKMIYRQQIKTGESISIPVVDEALAIVLRYEHSPERVVQGKVLPQISNQKLNLYLKTIGDLAGIEKTITHHMARHTCATFLLNKGVSLDIVSKLLGHATTKTTQIYAKMQNKTVQDSVRRAFAG